MIQETTYYDNDKLDRYVRDLSLKSITSDMNFEVSEDMYQEFIKSDLYQVYIKHFPDAVISGSSALRLFNMTDREFKSNRFLDKVLHSFRSGCSSRSTIHIKSIKNPEYVSDLDIINTKYDESFHVGTRYNTSILENYHGSVYFPNDVTVDLFTKEKLNFIQYKNIKVSPFVESVRAKAGIIKALKDMDRFGYYGDNKHFQDIIKIFKKVGINP
jgi:hypothetical protein